MTFSKLNKKLSSIANYDESQILREASSFKVPVTSVSHKKSDNKALKVAAPDSISPITPPPPKKRSGFMGKVTGWISCAREALSWSQPFMVTWVWVYLVWKSVGKGNKPRITSS
jgi:hypothetical protein